jgi:hypothetical protein
MSQFYRICLLCGLLSITSAFAVDWGFFAHRRINRLAVFTLPPEMAGFYKKYLEYITEHAVDPDKRRYVTRHEAVRHYIDIDHWGRYPFPQVPRRRTDALLRYATLGVVDSRGDTTFLVDSTKLEMREGRLAFTPSLDSAWLAGGLDINTYRRFFQEQVLPQYYEEEWVLDCDALEQLLGIRVDCRSAFVVDHFSEFGILPYHLQAMQGNLTEAFRQGSVPRILRLSAEMGHYLGDAHVPLHTTENYNGQLTGQEGIHAFWESRIPELFADEAYDFFVGKATYIEDLQTYFWDVVMSSHQLVDEVLGVEKKLSEEFPLDKQYCFEERLGMTIRTQCSEYARAYQERLGGQVEARMRQAILAVGCSWYTAWVDAGQPDLRRLGDLKMSEEELRTLRDLEERFQQGEQQGRAHN